MSKFKVGDEVVCVRSHRELEMGSIYTIRTVEGSYVGVGCETNCGWDETRFNHLPNAEPGMVFVDAPEATVEHTGGSSSYYTVRITHPTTPYKLPYDAECNDIIEALNMTPAEANNFKATWRTAAARMGKKKKGNTAVYDAEKCVFFSGRMLVAAKKEDV